MLQYFNFIYIHEYLCVNLLAILTLASYTYRVHCVLLSLCLFINGVDSTQKVVVMHYNVSMIGEHGRHHKRLLLVQGAI